jgi:carbonic anhydrase
VPERVDAGKIRLHAWWFDIAQADVLAYDEAFRRFVVINEGYVDRLLERLEADKR